MFEAFKNYIGTRVEISDRQWEELEKFLVFKHVKHGELMVEPGQIIAHGFFVMKGCLRNYIIKDDKEHILQFAPENWWIGANYAVAVPQPAFVYIDAVEDSKIALYNNDFVYKLLDTVPGFMEMRQELQQNQFRNLEKRVLLLLSSSAEERYTYFLNTYPNLSVRLPQKMIASYLGMTPQSLSRVRSHYFGNHRG
jgi:CRP-like cAMP-binding protein